MGLDQKNFPRSVSLTLSLCFSHHVAYKSRRKISRRGQYNPGGKVFLDPDNYKQTTSRTALQFALRITSLVSKAASRFYNFIAQVPTQHYLSKYDPKSYLPSNTQVNKFHHGKQKRCLLVVNIYRTKSLSMWQRNCLLAIATSRSRRTQMLN